MVRRLVWTNRNRPDTLASDTITVFCEGRLIKSPTRYITSHWAGEQGLVWSLFVNLIAIRICLFWVQEWLAPPEGTDFHTVRLGVMILAFLVHGALFVWQVTGTIRAYERYMRDGGAMAAVWGAQLALVLMGFWTMIYVLDAWQMTSLSPEPDLTQAEIQAARAAKYSIILDDNENSLLLTGSMELGITKTFLAQIIATPNIQTVILQSTGGNIYEARGLAQIIKQNGLNTRVMALCSSACTTVFIAGQQRELGPAGKLGFHQYRVNATYSVLNADPQAEQDKDRDLFRQAGVSELFLAKMFDKGSSDIWFPDVDELINANVVTSVIAP